MCNMKNSENFQIEWKGKLPETSARGRAVERQRIFCKFVIFSFKNIKK